MHLVTGGAGFIGSHLSEALLKDGRKIIILDDFNNYYDPTRKESNIQAIRQDKNALIIKGSITDEKLVNALFKKYNITKVVHLAARAGVRPSIQDPKLYENVNIRGTLNILEAMAKAGCKYFYFASSSSVYGNQIKVPFSETDDTSYPVSPYAASKKSCELLAYTYHKLYNINCVGFRFFTVYGERGRPDMAPYIFTKKIMDGAPILKYGDGSTKRDYTYIFDIISGVKQALDHKDFGYEIFNLGNSHTVTLNMLISTIEKTVGKKAIILQKPKQPGDVEKTFSDISKAKRLLNYDPKTNIKEGLTNFYIWLKNQK